MVVTSRSTVVFQAIIEHESHVTSTVFREIVFVAMQLFQYGPKIHWYVDHLKVIGILIRVLTFSVGTVRFLRVKQRHNVPLD